MMRGINVVGRLLSAVLVTSGFTTAYLIQESDDDTPTYSIPNTDGRDAFAALQHAHVPPDEHVHAVGGHATGFSKDVSGLGHSEKPGGTSFIDYPLEVLEILGHLKLSRDATVTVFAAASKALDDDKLYLDAQRLSDWSDTWLSILGWNNGLVGLAKDFVFNYLGRREYHNHNGPLLHALRGSLALLPEREEDFTDSRTEAVRQWVLLVCRRGRQLFRAGGPLHTMLAELQHILDDAIATEYLALAMKNHPEVKEAFRYLVGPRPQGVESMSTRPVATTVYLSGAWVFVVVLTAAALLLGTTAAVALSLSRRYLFSRHLQAGMKSLMLGSEKTPLLMERGK
eukprot:TRINITY_DN112735_c0_g1_i1.p1 TRINITY_DN112735_c0_g1~~TRINITY_DN112735_c0_g1_i1.p1  ORF type:complete len:341 (+),score=35.84 TRINITY_DN112735_c0_g1_i1:109-1131(+)